VTRRFNVDALIPCVSGACEGHLLNVIADVDTEEPAPDVRMCSVVRGRLRRFLSFDSLPTRLKIAVEDAVRDAWQEAQIEDQEDA
jgi:hypothetical protein